MIKFKATVVFEGSETSMPTDGWRDLPISDCARLNTWMVNRGVGRVTPKPILHLFDSTAEEFAFCSAWPGVYGQVAYFVDGGRKYKVCLACRKVAEAGGE